MDTLKVRDAKDVEDAVRAAVAAEQPLEIIGHGSKRAIGLPTATNAVLDLSALNAITSYEPQELIVTVQAGAPMADLLSLLDSRPAVRFRSDGHLGAAQGRVAGTVGGMIGELANTPDQGRRANLRRPQCRASVRSRPAAGW